MTSTCRICAGTVSLFLDLGPQPLSDSFLPAGGPGAGPAPHRYHLLVGACDRCHMVQLLEEVTREDMFNDHYPYRTGGSALMRGHFEDTARELLQGELAGGRGRQGRDPFIVELGCNDGTMLKVLADAGCRHLGVEPSTNIAATAVALGVEVLPAFFDRDTAERILADHGPADVVYAANTVCHIPYLPSILAGVRTLLTDDGVFVFEDPYLGDVVEKNSFDQIYDEHFFLFSATTVAEAARLHGLELVDVRRLPVHGGEVRYTLARPGARPVAAAVADLVRQEDERGLHAAATLTAFADRVRQNTGALVALLERLRSENARVVAYGATAKSATVTNFCGIGPELVTYVVDTTPEKQGTLTPGVGIPVVAPGRFHDDYPDYALLFAWNHADEIIANETAFRDSGGRWITYVPEVGVR